MNPLTSGITGSVLQAASVQLGAQPVSEFARFIPDVAATDGVQRIEWQASGENLRPGKMVVAGIGSRHTSSYTLI